VTAVQINNRKWQGDHALEPVAERVEFPRSLLLARAQQPDHIRLLTGAQQVHAFALGEVHAAARFSGIYSLDTVFHLMLVVATCGHACKLLLQLLLLLLMHTLGCSAGRKCCCYITLAKSPLACSRAPATDC
jgi:hypothetical protein